ncbi:MAG TPA: hypothetical protein VGO03_16990 [Acidimicrobiia bacterium]
MKATRTGTAVLARVLLAIGGLAAAFAWWGFAAQQTILNPSATRDAAVGLLAAKPVQDSAVNSLADQLVSMIPRGDANRAGISTEQARTLARQAATSALQDPALRRAFGNAIASMQQQLIDGDVSRNGLTIDTGAVTTAVHNAVANVDPAAAVQMPSTPVKLHFDTTKLPSLRGVDQHTNTVTLLAALIAIAAWFGAVLVHPEPWTATRIIGRRLFVIGALPLVFWVLIPAGLRAAHVSAAEVLSPLASAYGRRLAPPGFAVLGVGALLWVAGHLVGATAGAARRSRRGVVAPAAVPAVPRRGVNYTRAGTTEPLDVRV